MTIDDIYTAAINGDKEQLIQLLEAGEVNINQTIQGGYTAGVQTAFPLLFSVLAKMQETGYNYEILEILVRYGVNLDGCVYLTSDAFTRHIPILCYAIQDWKNIQLVRFFLERGAEPDVCKLENYADGHMEMYPLLYFAIQCWPTGELMDLLLHYGASPNHALLTYNAQQACSQELTHLFFSLIDQQSMEKTALLFCYGADLRATVKPGYGAVRELPFDKYIARVYPRFSGMLKTAFQTGSRQRRPVVKVDRNQFLYKKAVSGAPVRPAQQEAQQQQPDKMATLRELAMSLIDFDHKFRLRTAEAIRMSQQPGRKQKDYQDLVNLARNNRKEALGILNDLDKDHTGGGIKRWWNHYNGLETFPTISLDTLVYTNFTRSMPAHDGLQLGSFSITEDTITQRELDLLVKVGELSLLYLGAPEPTGNYRMSELILWEIEDATEVSRTEERDFSDREIRSALRERSQSMDSHEEFMNMLQGFGSLTNEERHLGNTMSTSSFFLSQARREENLRNYEAWMRNSTTVHVELRNQQMYYHRYQPIGIVLFTQDGRVSQLLTYTRARPQEIYLTDHTKIIFDYKEKPAAYPPAQYRHYALHGLKYFNIENADVLAPQPAYLTEDEWFSYIYACYRSQEAGDIKQRISMAYEKAAERKRSTIAYNR